MYIICQKIYLYGDKCCILQWPRRRTGAITGSSPRGAAHPAVAPGPTRGQCPGVVAPTAPRRGQPGRPTSYDQGWGNGPDRAPGAIEGNIPGAWPGFALKGQPRANLGPLPK